jgi:gamma-glutamyl hercynylcysteine S-oxide hydrolase
VAAAAPGSRLNLLLTDSHRIVATAVTHSLWVRHEPGAVLVASEPLDEAPGWRPVPDRSLVVATRETVEVAPLTDLAPPERGAPP